MGSKEEDLDVKHLFFSLFFLLYFLYIFKVLSLYLLGFVR